MDQNLLSKTLRCFFMATMMLTLLPMSAQNFIFKNEINGTNPSQFNPFTNGQETDPNVIATGIGRGTGLVVGTEPNAYSARGWNTIAVNQSAYFEFTITPATGYQINYTTLEFMLGFSGGPNNAPVVVRSNLTNYATNIPHSRASFAAPVIVDFSAAAYQQVTSPVTFRVYPFGSANANDRITIYDFIFKGTVTPLCNLALPVASQQQLFQPGNTLQSLVVEGSNLMWYATLADALDGSPALDNTTILSDGTTYYVTQSSNGCTSEPLAITATVNLASDAFGVSKFRWYPNPVAAILRIDGLVNMQQLEVYTMSGQQLSTQNINSVSITTDLSALSSGIYLVKVIGDGVSETFRIVKQ